MNRTKTKQIDFIYIIHKADNSFLKVNKVIKRYKHELQVIPLDEFEKMYRPLFNLSPYTNQLQNYPVLISYKGEEESTIYISYEFYNKIQAEYNVRNTFFENGFVVVLKTAKIINPHRGVSRVDDEVVRQFADNNIRTARKIEYCLRLIRYEYFQFQTIFAYIHQEQRILPIWEHSQEVKPLTLDVGGYFEKDNYLLDTLLKIEGNVSEYINVALQTFDQSFYMSNCKLRFMQLILCVEICLNNFFHEPTSHVVAQHTSALLSSNKEKANKVYNEMLEFYTIKRNILNGYEPIYTNQAGPQDFLRQKIIELESISREILKKLIRLNVKDKQMLMGQLSLKALPIKQ